MKFLIAFILLIFFSGCIIGSNDLAQEEFAKINQTQLEQRLTKNTSLETQNLSIASSLLTTAQNILKLKQELERLEKDIENINTQIKTLKLQESNSQESTQFLNYLNELTQKSMKFTTSLRNSVETWDKYISNAYINKNNISNIKINQSELAESITNPIESFE